MGHLRLCKVKTFSSVARFFYTEINITYALTIKKETKHFVSCSQSPTFAPVFWSYVLRPPDFGVWCNGNTADSGPAFPGSSPGTPTFGAAMRNAEDGVCNVSQVWGMV